MVEFEAWGGEAERLLRGSEVEDEALDLDVEIVVGG